MNINYKQPQFELFPGTTISTDEAGKPKYLLASLTLTSENLVVLSILCIMLTVFSFSIGFECGKRAVGLEAERRSVIARAQMPVVKKVELKPAAINTSAAAGTVSQKIVAGGLPQTVENTTQPIAPLKPLVDLRKPYTIQVASYKDAKYGEKEAIGLKKKGYETLTLTKGDYSILCVGRFATKDEANIFARKLKYQYKDYVVRRM